MRRRQLASAGLSRAIAAAALSLLAARPCAGCGPFFDYPVFTYEHHPDFPLARYAAGELGVIGSGYSDSYLYVAYRYLAGVGFDTAERAALGDFWDEKFNGKRPPREPAWKTWTAARAKIAGVRWIESIQPYREVDWVTSINCGDDAFRHAAETLDRRAAEFGSDSPHLRSWVQAQDAVFENCSGAPVIPEPAPDDAPPVLRADRAYQIAAAHFYAGELDAARDLFRAIAADATSPWRALSAYVVARTSIRAGHLDAAETELRALLADTSPEAVAYHAAAERLLGFVRIRLHPAERSLELAAALRLSSPATVLKQNLEDYAFLGAGARDSSDDMNGWISAYGGHAAWSVERWEHTPTLPWLLAALAAISPDDPRAGAVLAAARAVAPDSPAHLTVAYHQFRVLAAGGRAEEARQRLDALLADERSSMPPSSLNAFLSLRARLARDLEELLRFGQQVPVGIIGFDGYEHEMPNHRLIQEPDETWADRPFDVNGELRPEPPLAPELASEVLKALESSSVSGLARAARYAGLDPALRRRVLLAVWVRAALLGRDALALELLPALVEAIPELGAPLDDYRRARTPEEREFAAALAMLRVPGMTPSVEARATALTAIDDFRRNWWCAIELDPDAAAPGFLDADDLAAARREATRLANSGAAPEHLIAEALVWAKTHRSDGRVPEALYLAVRATRYGCGESRSGELSHAAFRLLHDRYPKSDWTARTPYWFRG